jgi:hypothetical protein
MSSQESQRERVPRLLRNFAASLGNVGPSEEDLILAATESCKELLQAKQCSVWLLDKSKERLELRAATGYSNLDKKKEEEIGSMSYPLRRQDGKPIGTTASIFVSQQPISADSYAELKTKPGYGGLFDSQLHGLQEKDSVPDDQHPCQQFYGGPITLGPEKFGVLKVENKRATDSSGRQRFSNEDKDALDTVAAILALALKYARVSQDAREQLVEYHHFTVHSMRNEMLPIQGAESFLRELSAQNEENAKQFEKPLRFLRLGGQGMSFYLEHLLKFLRAEIDPARLEDVEIVKIARSETWLLGEVASDELDAELEAEGFDGVTVKADAEFVAATFKEILRNSRKATYNRRAAEKRKNQAQRRGKVRVTFSIAEPDERIPERHLRISFSDDGEAAALAAARERLEQAWERVVKRERQTEQKGLVFIDWVISKHQGYVELNGGKTVTAFDVHLPMTKS